MSTTYDLLSRVGMVTAMVEWYWLPLAAWGGALVGVMAASLCAINNERN
ncbi:hypothetical protein [Anaerospora hongkongensis]|nr:hypothetical protein [Anaerospora hongkongensis]